MKEEGEGEERWEREEQKEETLQKERKKKRTANGVCLKLTMYVQCIAALFHTPLYSLPIEC